MDGQVLRISKVGGAFGSPAHRCRRPWRHAIFKSQDMLDIFYEHGHEIRLMLNFGKSMSIMFGKRLSNSLLPIMFINGMDVKWNNEYIHI